MSGGDRTGGVRARGLEAPSAVPGLRSRRPRIVRRLADRPRIGDALVILACTVPMGFAIYFLRPQPLWLACASVAGVAVALWWRRRHPYLVLVAVMLLASVNPVLTPGDFPVFENAFVMYTIAARDRWPRVLAAYAASIAIPACAGIASTLLTGREAAITGLVQPVTIAAVAIGIAVRASAARREALESAIALREERAALAERARITAEMHDVVAHSVTVMIALAGGARVGWEKHPERARAALEQLGAVGAQALEEMQRILRVLRDGDRDLDAALETSGYNLPPLEDLVEVFRVAGLPVSLRLQGEVPPDPALQTTVYRVVQEALTNVLRHAADPTRVEVEVVCRDGELAVSVTDDGTGGPGAGAGAGAAGAGVGLRAMRERANAFRGSLEAGPAAGPGARGPGSGGRAGDGSGSPGSAPPRPGWRTRVSLQLRAEASA